MRRLITTTIAFCALVITSSAFAVSPIYGGGGASDSYVMDGGIMTNFAPLDSTTYYVGYGEGITAAQHATIANCQMIVPKTGTITRVHWQIFINTNGSNEAVSHFLRLNNTTDTTLSTSETYDPGANVSKAFTYTGLSIAVTAGDTIAFKIVGPIWVTNPTLTTGHLLVWIN